MGQIKGPVGIVGGTGQLGGAIARALLSSGTLAPHELWLCGRSGRAEGFDAWHWINVTTDPQALVAACPTVLFALPPAVFEPLQIAARDNLVVSVMAGVTIDDLCRVTGSSRIVRAMSSPVAEHGLAYSPWCASRDVSEADRAQVAALFAPCGPGDEVADEDHIDRFTALTGPVPGFVAYLAQCMIDHAVDSGIERAIANRAVRQLFIASADAFQRSSAEPADHVKKMLDYAGTTAAGLQAMIDSPLSSALARGLDAAHARAKTIARDQSGSAPPS